MPCTTNHTQSLQLYEAIRVITTLLACISFSHLTVVLGIFSCHISHMHVMLLYQECSYSRLGVRYSVNS